MWRPKMVCSNSLINYLLNFSVYITLTGIEKPFLKAQFRAAGRQKLSADSDDKEMLFGGKLFHTKSLSTIECENEIFKVELANVAF